jgi:pheganomycin biosynthesis PGM1-like protein
MASRDLGSVDEHNLSLRLRLGGLGPTEMEAGTLLVIPSITFPEVELRKIVGIEFYEERMLCLLLLLKNPCLRVVFVSSLPIDSFIVDYYLSFLPDPESARDRLELIAVRDDEPRALTYKLLDHPDVMESIRDAIDDPGEACAVVFNVTPAEQALCRSLGVALYGPHASLIPLGSKSGSRKTARDAGVPVLEGAEDLTSLAEIESAIVSLRGRRPEAGAAVIKLNNGFSGQGNAIIELERVTTPLTATETLFCAENESWASYLPKVEADGAIVEELTRGTGTVSPSVQLRILPDGSSEVVSTHDQILGGPDDQVYLGCRFPASEAYRAAIQEHGLRVAEVLATKGVVGSFGIDFVVVPRRGAPMVYLSEINLRLGGTTHPYVMARLATGGEYEPRSGELLAGGQPRVYVSTDNLKSKAYAGLKPREIVEALEASGLAFDRDSRTGVTLHLLGALRDHGKLGIVCISETSSGAEELELRTVEALGRLVKP